MSTNIISPAGTLTITPGPLDTVSKWPSPVDVEAEIAHHLNDLDEALRQPNNLAPVTAASLAILRICTTYATATRNDELIEAVGFAVDLLNQSPEAGMGLTCTAQDLVRAVTPFITHTAALIDHATLVTAVPTIRLALWQSAQQFIERDPDINPFLLSDLGWDIARSFKQGMPAHCDTLIRTLATEILTSVSLSASPCVDKETDLRIGYDPIATDTGSTAEEAAGSFAAASLPVVIRTTTCWPTATVEAALARLRPRQIRLSELLQQQASVQLRREQARIDQRIQDLQRTRLDPSPQRRERERVRSRGRLVCADTTRCPVPLHIDRRRHSLCRRWLSS